MTRPITTVLFDLDGTVANSAPGILASLRHAFQVNGLTPLSAEQERGLLGPPFYESLPTLIDPALVGVVIASYREVYGGGAMLDAVAYDGIPALLQWLREQGCTLGLATSKPEHYARPIVEHLGVGDYFDTICGDTLDGSRGSKALVIGEALSRLGQPEPTTVLMVGDRAHDVIGARAHGIGCLGAGWGYGSEPELLEAGALAVYATVSQLRLALPARLGVEVRTEPNSTGAG